jgi:hypothetical protein
MGTLFVDKLDPQSGTSLELGSSGDTITIPSGATITNNGTQTGFGGTNVNLFRAYRNGQQTIDHSTVTKVQLNAENFDVNSKFDSSTNYRYTPASTGYYYLSAQASFSANNSSGDMLRRVYVHIYKNGASLVRKNLKFKDSGGDIILDYSVSVDTIDNSTSASDYYEVFVETNNPNGANNTDVVGGTIYTYFQGYKLIT